MVAGAATVILWTQSDVLKDLLYEMIPGFAVSLVAIVVVSLLTQKPAKEIQEQFDSYQKFTK